MSLRQLDLQHIRSTKIIAIEFCVKENNCGTRCFLFRGGERESDQRSAASIAEAHLMRSSAVMSSGK